MKLRTLKADNFVGLDHAEVMFDKPVTLITGRNNQGKSSIKDALLFALTGKCRAMRFNKEVGNIIRGSNGMAVELEWGEPGNEFAEVIKRSKSTVGVHVDERPVLRYCLNPSEFIALSPKERAKILSDVLGGGLNDVIKQAIIDHIGSINETVLSEVKGSGVNILDIDVFRNQVVQQRREYKRLIEQLSDRPPLLGDYELDADYDIARDQKAVRDLAVRITKGSEMIAQAQRMVDTKAEIFQLGKDIEKLEAGRQKVPNLPRGVSKDKLTMAPVYLSIQETMLSESDSSQCKCLVCATYTDRKALQLIHDDLAEWYNSYAEKVQAREQAIEHNARIDDELKLKTNLLGLAKSRLVEVDVPKGGEDLLATLQAERDAAQKRMAKYQLWQDANDSFKQAGAKRQSLTALVAECNRIDEALKDGGPVKSAIAAGGRKLPINESLLQVWGMTDLAWSDNGEITLGHLPIEYASKSERQRAACIMALALAQVSGIGIAAIDEEFDALDDDNRNRFFGAVTECGLSSVLVCSSTTRDYSQVHVPDWLTVFAVDAGKVTRVA